MNWSWLTIPLVVLFASAYYLGDHWLDVQEAAASCPVEGSTYRSMLRPFPIEEMNR